MAALSCYGSTGFLAAQSKGQVEAYLFCFYLFIFYSFPSPQCILFTL